MKNRKWLHLVLIIGCVAVFLGYRAVDRIRTDTKAPEITVSGESLQLSVQEPESALLTGITAKDNFDGDVTSSLVVESVRLEDSSGAVTVTYAAFDRAGNVARLERQAQYTDYESPTFSLTAPLAFPQNTGTDVLSIIKASDALDGDITHRIRATSLDEGSISALGVHDVQFRVTNSMGETVELVLPVEVYLAGAYQASLELTEYLVYLPVGSAFNAQSYLSSFTLGADETSLRGSLPKNYTLRTDGTVDTSTPGVYSVSYKVTYTRVNETNADLNQSYTGYSKLIVVVEG